MKKRWLLAWVRVAAHLGLAGLVLVLWFYLAAENTNTPEMGGGSGEAGLPVVELRGPPPLLERLRAWLGW